VIVSPAPVGFLVMSSERTPTAPVPTTGTV
jgi:hypothetical protein